jgi:hypothetical protein
LNHRSVGQVITECVSAVIKAFVEKLGEKMKIKDTVRFLR